LLQDLADRGIELWVEGERLRFRAPEGALTEALRQTLASRKAEVIAALREDLAGGASSHPASYNQRSLWFLYKYAPASTAYNVAFAARICSPIDRPALRDAFQALVDRHATLRTTYKMVNEELRQVVHRSAELAFAEVDASGWSDAALHDDAVRCYRAPFDLERGPLLRVTLFARRPDEHVLLLSAHHIAIDGWSTWILLDELRTLYAARVHNAPAVLPRSAVEYTDYAAAQEAQIAGPEGEALWAYWQARLAGPLPILRLPADRPRLPVQTFSGASCTRWLSAELQAALGRVAKAEGATPFVVLLAGYFTLLQRYSGQLDLIVGSPTFGRNRTDYQNLVGDCIGMVPLRADLSGDPAFRELLGRIRQTVVGALEHQDFPFALMVERLAQRSDFSRSPVFQTVFTFQKPQRASDLTALFAPAGTPRRVDFGGLLLEAYALPQQEGQFDLALDLVETGDTLAATAKYNTDLFEAATVERLLENYVALLEAVVADPAAPLSTLAMPGTTNGLPLQGNAAAGDPDDEARDVFEV
jgi:Condensation domain/TubC N-terminal docking domain